MPVYNNGATVRDIASGGRSILKNVLVADDGSTDVDITAPLSGLDVVVLKHGKNLGKGRAILTAYKRPEFSYFQKQKRLSL